MIDWVTAELPCRHVPLRGGVVCKTDRQGQVEWETNCFLSSAGSYEARIQYKSAGGDGQGRATHLLISGNPAKFLQGHNVFGSNDLVGLVYDTYLRLCEIEGLSPDAADIEAVMTGDYELRRIDINESFELPSRSDVLSWIRAAEYCSNTRHGRPASKGGTLYWGKSSKRWSFKGYCKGEEIESKKAGHELPLLLQQTPLMDWADNKLRLELVIRGKQLDELGLSRASTLNETAIEALYKHYLGKISMTKQMKISDEILRELPRALHSTYSLWLDGHDLRSMLTKSTYYRHRVALLSLHNIDIALHRENSGISNVVPLIRILEASPAVIPDWAYELGLIHVPPKHCRINSHVDLVDVGQRLAAASGA